VTDIEDYFAHNCPKLTEISCADETQIELVKKVMRKKERSNLTFINRSANQLR
jgi:hypothetical protein